MTRNATVDQTRWQQAHRLRKARKGECSENGCHTETDGHYRCAYHRRLHTDQELARQQLHGKDRK